MLEGAWDSDFEAPVPLCWTPLSVHNVCVYVFSMNGALAFVDTSDCTLMNIAEHYMASDVEWDPTGRYVVTSVSWWSHKVTLPRHHRDIDLGNVYLLKISTQHIVFPTMFCICV